MNTGLPVKAHPCLSDLLVLFLLRKFKKSKLPVFFMVRNFKKTYFSDCKFVGQNCLLKTCQGVKGFTQISPNLVQFAAALSAHSFFLTMGPLFVESTYRSGYRKLTLCVSVLSYYCSKNHQSCVPRVILDMNNTLLLWLMKQEMNLQLQPKTQAILKFHRNELLLLLDEDNDDDSIITDFELYNSSSHLPGTLSNYYSC